ncbi:hypothetical protein EU527_17465 [Candidatus Thorarchaeota archaeon]|nr:MAG: hypothetical protein EU527_17465 [Candidatus Thorarchaeota archaeon]
MTYSDKDLKNYLKDLVKGKSSITNFSFEYQSGHTSFHTRLRILVTSEKIEHRRIPRGIEVDSPEEAQATKVRETSFSAENLKSFVEVLLMKKIWDQKNCTDRALPDTALLTFLILDNGSPIFSQEVWESCRNDDARTKDLIRALSAIIPRDWTPP